MPDPRTQLDIELGLLTVIDDKFAHLHTMLRTIQEKLTQYPASVQLDFLKPIESMLFEATMDTLNPDDTFLNQDTPNIEL